VGEDLGDIGGREPAGSPASLKVGARTISRGCTPSKQNPNSPIWYQQNRVCTFRGTIAFRFAPELARFASGSAHQRPLHAFGYMAGTPGPIGSGRIWS